MVIGPFDPADWLTLKMLRGSVAWMKKQPTNKFELGIKKEQSLFKHILSSYLTPANDNNKEENKAA